MHFLRSLNQQMQWNSISQLNAKGERARRVQLFHTESLYLASCRSICINVYTYICELAHVYVNMSVSLFLCFSLHVCMCTCVCVLAFTSNVRRRHFLKTTLH